MTLALLLVLAGTLSASGQQAETATTFLTHPDEAPFYLGGQVNIIFQAHPAFPSPYTGPHSLRPDAEHAISQVVTLFTGARIGSGWEVAFDVESAAGKGIGNAFGLAGYTDLDVVRNPELGAAPYVARAVVRKIIALSSEMVAVTPTPISFAAKLPARRLDIRAGKFGIVDYFDLNAVGNDSHLQFTNWTVDNNGGYDYAADTRGYTYGVIVEYATPRWSLRGAEALMPKVANGIVLDWNLARARGENLELDLRPRDGVVIRALGYANHANMGSYEAAIAAFLSDREAARAEGRQAVPPPDIEAHRAQGRVKYGFGLNLEYAAAGGVRFFGRTGWNEGRHESFAYTEVNNTLALGADLAGPRWQRPHDRAGIAFVSNGLSDAHRRYLELGGLGFLLGDGRLRYGRETIVESYYTAHVTRGLFASAGAQFVARPGYNRDRGPLIVPMLRLHADF